MKITKITLILTIIAIMIFSCGKSNAELKNEFINLTKDKIFLGGYDKYNKKRIIYTFDENGNIVDDKNEIKYYYDSAKSDSEFYFYFIVEAATYNEEAGAFLPVEITNYTGFVISNNIVREMVHEIIESSEEGVNIEEVNNKKELQKLYSKKGSYTVGILFDSEEYNDYKNIVKTYKYSDFFGTFESDKNFFVNLSQHKNKRRTNVYSMLFSVPNYSYIGNEPTSEYDFDIFYNNGLIYSLSYSDDIWVPEFDFIIIDKDTLLHVIVNNIYSFKDYSGLLKRKSN